MYKLKYFLKQVIKENRILKSIKLIKVTSYTNRLPEQTKP
jgi:hypothetical protein